MKSLLVTLALAIVAITGATAHAAERTWITHGEVTHCEGVLTSNNVCIGSESYVDQSDNHEPIDGSTDVFRSKDDDK
jgi:hypothetical protein